MNTIAYFVYGNKREYKLELTYSVLSAVQFLHKEPSSIRLVLITDEENRRDDLPVEHLVFSAQDLARWTRNGAYNHEAKIHALLTVMDRFKGAVALIDTDTYFRSHPRNLFERVGPGRALMHSVDGNLEQFAYWDPILNNLSAPVAGYDVSCHSPMFNSGVIGVDYSSRSILDDVIPLVTELHNIYPVFNIEQFALTAVLGKHFDLSVCPDIVYHYWGYERRFIHAQIENLFPSFGRQLFNSYIEDIPSVGYPAKTMTSQIVSRLKSLQRGQGGDYRFAYLAYMNAISSKNHELANAWAHTALDLLVNNNFNCSHIQADFKKMRPKQINSHHWIAPETKQRWESYWRAQSDDSFS